MSSPGKQDIGMLLCGVLCPGGSRELEPVLFHSPARLWEGVGRRERPVRSHGDSWCERGASLSPQWRNASWMRTAC